MSDTAQAAATAAPKIVPVPQPQPPALSPHGLKLAESIYRTYSVTVESVLPRDAILQPGFWANVAHKMRPLDRIEVMDAERNWLSVLFVRSVGTHQALVKELWRADLSPGPAADLSAEFEVIHRGPRKWSVKRLSDKAILSENMETREEAEGWLRSNLKALAA